MTAALDSLESRCDQMRAQVKVFHEEHPEVWTMFCRFAFELLAAGYEHGGVGAIWERMRWETSVNPIYGDSFKLNNNFRAFYARAFNTKYPENGNFFRQRVQISKRSNQLRGESNRAEIEIAHGEA